MNALLKSFIYAVLKEQEDYKGEHTAPSKEGNSPLWDLTFNETYPEDVYSHLAARYYGDHSGNHEDHAVVSLIQSARNKPKKRIKIYRAVPLLGKKKIEKEIAKLQKEKWHIMKYGKPMPQTVIPFGMNSSEFYEHISNKLDEMEKSLAATENEKINKINPGDWVTIYRPYAVDHGIGALNDSYRILSKIVTADTLWTNGDSLYEWGWVP